MSAVTNEALLAESIRMLAVKTLGLLEDPRQTGLHPASRLQLRAVEAGQRHDS
jgi:hypothetical protein